MAAEAEVILASSSARRAQILEAAGVAVRVIAPAMDDAQVPLEVRDPCAFVMSLAWFKARVVLGQIAQGERGGSSQPLPRWLVAADTMCVQDGHIIGKAADAAEMRRMLRSFQGREHDVVTGVCIIDRNSNARQLFFDSATVQMGELTAQQLDQHESSNLWRGKAGAYNLEDSVQAGWPVRCQGDPQTVMGLPSRLVLPAIGVQGTASGRAS